MKSIWWWSNVFHPCRALVFMGIYLSLTTLAFANRFFMIDRNILNYGSVLGVILMIPSYVSPTKQRLRFSAELVSEEPISICTEGESSTKPPGTWKMFGHLLLVTNLSLVCILMSVFGTTVGGVIVIYQIVNLSTSSRWRECLAKYQNDTTSIQVTSSQYEYDEQTYDVNRHGNIYTMNLNQASLTSDTIGLSSYPPLITILVDYPRSGYPTDLISYVQKGMMDAYYAKMMQISSLLVAVALYIWSHWYFVYVHLEDGGGMPYGNDTALEGKYMIIDWVITCAAPIMLVPYCMYARKWYVDSCVEKLINGAKVVSVRRSDEDQPEEVSNQFSISKGIQVKLEGYNSLRLLVN